MLLLIGSGITTAVPLMLFGAAAIRIPLAMLGLLQYIAPVMRFLIGVALEHEAMPLSRLAAFALAWAALAVFMADALRDVRPTRCAARQTAMAPSDVRDSR